MSNSSLRFVAELDDAIERVPSPGMVSLYGPVGGAPSGSSIVWYGIHAFEMLHKVMGGGATSVSTQAWKGGYVCVVEFEDARHGVVELTEDSMIYGGYVRSYDKAAAFTVDISTIYDRQLEAVAAFFSGEDVGCMPLHSIEVMALLSAADLSARSGRSEPVKKCKD